MKDQWNLSLLYSSAGDPRIEADIAAYEKASESFEKRYKLKAARFSDESTLAKALRDYETLFAMPEPRKVYHYFHHRTDLDAADAEAERKLNLVSDRLTKADNRTLFFQLALGKVPVVAQRKLLVSKRLAPYRYFLERVFETAKHDLSESEEKILSLKSLPAQSLWVRGQEKLLGGQTVLWKGKKLPVPEAQNMVSQLPTKERRALHDATCSVLRSISDFAESELNAVYTDKKINDELRGFAKPYSATVLRYQNDERSIESFVDTVTKRFDISHRFYDLKAKVLRLDTLEYADRAAKAGKVSFKPSFGESVSILRSALEKADPRFREMLDSFLEGGQIDAYPRKGKRGGAFCSGDIGVPTLVLLNHVDSLNALMTFAHEMGHAFHTELSKSQPPLFQNYTISVAEVASTFFENVAFEEIFPKLSKKEQLFALHDRLNDSVATVFRQVAVWNYELEMHTAVRERGALTKEEMAALHNKHMAAYLGPRFRMKENDGYYFVSWPHLRYFFYVYSYAYGELISKAMYRTYKEDKGFISKVIEFLSAGGSKSPEDIFKGIGIDVSRPGFFADGLKALQDDIMRLESLLGHGGGT